MEQGWGSLGLVWGGVLPCGLEEACKQMREISGNSSFTLNFCARIALKMCLSCFHGDIADFIARTLLSALIHNNRESPCRSLVVGKFFTNAENRNISWH